MWARDGGTEKTSLGAELRRHGVTVAAGFFSLVLVGLLDYATGPEIACEPFYMIPCALLALVAGPGWATVAALAAAASATACREGAAHHFHAWLSAAAIWNGVMRFVFFQFFVLLLDRIRRHLGAPGGTYRGAPPE